MRQFKLEDIVKETVQFVAQSGMSFEDLNLPEQGVAELYNVMEIAGILPVVVPKARKSDVDSDRLRARGNQAFVSSKDDMEALELYTKAVSCAQAEGKDVSLAYANRSAVTFALLEYRDSIKDIDRALSGHYPDHLKFKLFERRGRCFFALSQYDEALKDFEQTKNQIATSKLSRDKKESLLNEMSGLIEQCVDKSHADVCSSDETIPGLSHSQSPYIQCASTAVDIKYTPQMGRHVVAATDIHPGDVLAVERPYASVVLPPHYNLFCEWCKKRCHSSIPCLSCTEVVYCNETCRDRSWLSHHSIECDLLPSLLAIGCDKMEFLALRVLLQASKCGENFQKFVEAFLSEFPEGKPNTDPETLGFVDDKYQSDVYCATHHLETNRHLRCEEDLIRRGTVATCIVYLLQEATGFFKICDPSNWRGDEKHVRQFSPVSDLSLGQIVAADLILRYLMSAPCNAHEIAEMRVWSSGEGWESESTEIGGAVYPFHSLLNHSCDPNVVRHAYSGDVVVLSAIQFIPKGEQIFDNYGYHHAIHDIATRQLHLQAQYYFSCECVACRENWPLYHDLPEGHPEFISSGSEKKVLESSEKFAKTLLEIRSGKINDEQMEFLKQHLTLLHFNVKRPWKEYNQCQEAIKQCLSLRANHYFHVKGKRFGC